MADEAAWLIEHPNNKLKLFVGMVHDRPIWLALAGNTGSSAHGTFYWTIEHKEAFRFGRRRDATMFIGAMRQLNDLLPHKDAVAGLRSDDPTPSVVEHMWMDDADHDEQGPE